MQPFPLALVRGGRCGEFGAIQPAADVKAVLRHRHIGKHGPNLIGDARNPEQVHVVIGIWNGACRGPPYQHSAGHRGFSAIRLCEILPRQSRRQQSGVCTPTAIAIPHAAVLWCLPATWEGRANEIKQQNNIPQCIRLQHLLFKAAHLLEVITAACPLRDSPRSNSACSVAGCEPAFRWRQRLHWIPPGRWEALWARQCPMVAPRNSRYTPPPSASNSCEAHDSH